MQHTTRVGLLLFTKVGHPIVLFLYRTNETHDVDKLDKLTQAHIEVLL